jgi:hypothetical protein
MRSTLVEYRPAGSAGKAPVAVQGGIREDLMGVGGTSPVPR